MSAKAPSHVGSGRPVQSFYSSHVEAVWSRWDRYARVEEYVWHRLIADNLPGPPATIFDVGGGNGRHAFYLAKMGYHVELCDITEPLVTDARRRNSQSAARLGNIMIADARKLPWRDSSAEAVLLLGPMYCLRGRQDRLRVLSEARRVLKPGGVVIIQYLARIAALRSILEVAPDAGGIFSWQEFLDSGQFSEETLPDFFRIHYFSSPANIVAELGEAGLAAESVRGVDGPATIYAQRTLVDAPEESIRQWGEIALAVGEDPEYRSTSTHLCAIARHLDEGGCGS
jgi:ubiquinone/menaquinone biosynthesis C-methylase UbiE